MLISLAIEGIPLVKHGLGLLSAVAKQNGHETMIINAHQYTDLGPVFQLFRPELVGISVLSMDYPASVHLARSIKNYNQGIIICVGGPHPTFVPEDFDQVPEVDYVFRGEAEITFPRLLNRLQMGTRPEHRIIEGVSVPYLETLPFVDRSGYEYGEYQHAVLRGCPAPAVTLLAGRGCCYQCRFCKPGTDLLFGKKMRRRSVEHVMAELATLKFGSLIIHDDNLLEDSKWIEEFLQVWDGRPFCCQGRANIIVRREKMIAKMAEKGLKGILIGFESGSQRILDFFNKGTTVEQNIKAAEICHKYGITVQANIMFGAPTETREDVDQTIAMMKKLEPCIFSLAVFIPIPGSELYHYCRERDLSLIDRNYDYERSYGRPKIKGVDYEYINKTLEENFGFKFCS